MSEGALLGYSSVPIALHAAVSVWCYGGACSGNLPQSYWGIWAVGVHPESARGLCAPK